MTSGVPSILDANGNPIPPSRRRVATAGRGAGRYQATLQGGTSAWPGPAYDAADIWGTHMAAWQPYLWSPDAELNMYRDRIVSRVRDLVRNDGWASGAVTRILDNAIGANLRPIAKPDYKFLARELDDRRYDLSWAQEWAKVADATWRAWACDDQGKYCDATRNQELPDLFRTAFRHKLIDGDALAVMGWLPERVGIGRARYATCVQHVDPDRLSNPQLRFDQQTQRGGVEVDEYGAAVAYYIRRAHAGDWFSAAESLHWDRIPRETEWGRAIVVHDYDSDRASQHRGGAGIFTPVLQRMKMLVKYDGVELDAAIVNSMFGAYVESPFDPQLVGQALDDGEQLSAYQNTRTAFYQQNDIALGNVRLPIMFPGEKVNAVHSERPNGNFKAFENAVLRNVATSTGLSAQQLSNDWSDVNYSSARGALLEAWKTLHRRRHDFAKGFCSPVRSCWLEESVEVDDYPWPGNRRPLFPAVRGALSRARWLGPALGWLDPVAEVQASVMRMEAGLSTLEDEAAVQGLEWEEVLEQRKFEIDKFAELGIALPQWGGAMTAESIGRAPIENQPGAKPERQGTAK
jgi:lambda family phage portal protein